MNLVTRKSCRICGSESLTPLLSLGDQLLGSHFPDSKETGLIKRAVPLDLVRCNPQFDEKSCGLVQLRHTVPAELMFSNYWYQSGTNQTMTDHLSGIASEAEKIVSLEAGSHVLDIGCNDGTLLKGYRTNGIRRVGFEPSETMGAMAKEKGIEVIHDFFNAEAFRRKYKDIRCDLITSIAMFYDLEDPHQFVSDIRDLLDADGVWVLELSYMPSMLEQNSFDTICHEHLEYYHLAPLEALLGMHGLKVIDVALNDSNGGSFRLFITHEASKLTRPQGSQRLSEMRRREFELGLDTDTPFRNFRESCQRVRNELIELIDGLIAKGKTIGAYGASTKGNTLLQYCGITGDRITAVADRNPRKWNRKTPGTNIPIKSENEVRALRPDYLLVLPWHFMSEFVLREGDYLRAGGKFIAPLPRVQVLGQTEILEWQSVKKSA